MEIEKAKMITCLLPKDEATPLLERLYHEKGITTASLNHARGTGMVSPQGKKGFGQQIEKDVLNVVVSEREAEEIFEFIYHEGRINRPHGGFMYMGPLERSTVFRLPKIEEEKS